LTSDANRKDGGPSWTANECIALWQGETRRQLNDPIELPPSGEPLTLLTAQEAKPAKSRSHLPDVAAG